MAERADLVVIGMGVGGEEVAGACAQAGLSVIGIDQRLLGGECPYFGCVPTKMMVRATDALAEARRVDRLARSATAQPDWTPVARRIRDEATDNWHDGIGVEIEASRAVIATGTEPVVPPVSGLAGTPYWTDREAVQTETAPESLVVLGGGTIGAELAQVFARLGSRVPATRASSSWSPTPPPASWSAPPRWAPPAVRCSACSRWRCTRAPQFLSCVT